MTDICRLCASLKTLDQLKSIAEPSLRLYEKLSRCCSVSLELPSNDELMPQSVCQECLQQINISWNFAEKVCQAQEILKKAFLSQTTEDHETDQQEGNAFDGTLNRNKIQTFSKSSPVINELSLKLRSMIISLHSKGYSEAEICQKLNLKSNLVDQWIEVYEREWNIINVASKNDAPFCIEKKELVIELTNEKTESDTENQQITSHAGTSDVIEIVEYKMENGGANYAYVDLIESQLHSNESHSNPDHRKDDEVTYAVNERIEVDEISEDEESDCEETETLNFPELNDDEKNEDGTISQKAVEKLKMQSWTDYPWNCRECGIQMVDIHDLRQHHISTHQSSSKYCCIDCSKVFNKYATFLSHVRIRHRSHLKYCCDICSTFFWNLKSMEQHRSDHSDKDRSYLCSTCGKGFRCHSTLQVHYRSHLPTDLKNTYHCEICFKKFGTKPNLMAHKRIHTGVRDYICEQCGKEFVQKGNLENHRLTHFQNKPFSCDCGKTFKTQLRLMKHKTVHTDLKPHKCQHCAKEFREKGTLKEHMRIHLNLMPFSCEFCQKKFRFKGVLTTHRRQHTGERPYSCVECNHHFTNWPNYNKHMKRRHGINTSVTVRKPQLIPPSGIPPTKLNHVVPTVHNTAYVQQSSILADSRNGHIANNEMMETICEKDVVCVNDNGYATTVQEVNVIVNNENILRKSPNQTGSQITILSHPHRNINQQVLTTSSSNQLTPQYSYLPAGSTMLGFYNIQGVDLIQNSNVEQQ